MMSKNRTFGGIPEEYARLETSKIILQSIPYDQTSTWGAGADLGFQAMLDAAENMELYDIETDSEVYRRGIHIPSPLSDIDSPRDLYRESYDLAKTLLKTEKFLTFFGGNHSISIGVMQAFIEKYQDITILQLDAHADLRPEYLGSPYNHACAMHAASKSAQLIQVGIRSMDISEKSYMDTDRVYFADSILSRTDWMEDSINQMTDQVYVTLDLDVLDPSIMPATGTPEPNGLDWQTITDYLKLVFQSKEVVGFDIVELAPILSVTHPQFLAAKLYYKLLSYKFEL